MWRAALEAVVLHAALIAVIARVPPSQVSTIPGVESPPEMEVDIDVATEPAALRESEPSRAPASAPAQALARATSSVVPNHAQSVMVDAPSEAPAGSESTSQASHEIPELVRPSLAQLGLEGTNRFMNDPSLAASPTAPAPEIPKTLAEETAEANTRVQAALRAPARERERELGLGPEGPVLRELGEATSAGATPVRGQALFLAIADGDGSVISIRFVQGTGTRGPWDDVAKAALDALRGKKLRMPHGARGAEMSISVSSDWKLPSGHDPGTDVSVFRIPVGKGEGKQSTRVTLLDPPIPHVKIVPVGRMDPSDPSQPDPTDPLNKIAVPQFEFTIVRVDGDPVDLGSKARRVVHTRLVSSKIL